jgi:hypothetical protein
MRIARQQDELVCAMTSGALQVTAAQAILDGVPDEEMRVQMVRDVLRQNEQRRQVGRTRLTVEEIRQICRARRCQISARELAQAVTPRGSAELAVTPRPQAWEGAERKAASETTVRRHTIVTDCDLMEMRGRFSGLHVLDLLMEDPAPDDVRVFAALALDVVEWHGKVGAHRDARLPRFVRAPCAELSGPRVVDRLQALLART